MYLSKRKNGYWYIYYDNQLGKRNSLSARTKIKGEALKFLSNFKDELKTRQSLKTIPINLKFFLFEYLKHSEVIHSENTTKSIKSTVNALIKYFGNIEVTSLNKEKISNYITYRIKQNSVYVGKRETAYLSAICKFGISKHYLTENLIKGIHKIRVPEKQPLFFSEIDFEILLQVIDKPDIKDLVIFAVNTGLRQMELLTLKWNQINFKDKIMILDNREHVTKSKKVRSIPLNIKAMQVLTKRQLSGSKSDFVFTIEDKPITQSYISHKFKKYIRKAGLNPNLNFHSLRSTFASWLIQRGANIHNVSKLLGHSSTAITESHYAFLKPDNLVESVNILN